MYIKRLMISRYRYFRSWSWDPKPGVNCLIGPGDTGKSTVLSAVCLLLAPYNPPAPSEFDYHLRRVHEGFSIEAFIAGIDEGTFAAGASVPPLKGWRNGQPVSLPEDGTETVLHCRVRGTPDMELVYELPTEDGDCEQFSVGLRKKLLLARLAGEERSGRDLCLSAGSLLDRYLEPTHIRSAIHSAVASAAAALLLPSEVVQNLSNLAVRFDEEGLPKDLHLGLFPQQGTAATAMLALFSGKQAHEAIPLAFAGSGTRQLAVLSLSTANLAVSPLITLDEPERGLEAYRQRRFIAKVIDAVGTSGQAFVTTHSSAVLAAMSMKAVWRMRPAEKAPALITSPSLAGLLRRDPEAFFAPIPLVCEGPTEIGLLKAFLPKLLPTDYHSLGIHLVNGTGQPAAFSIIEEFHSAGIRCAAFLDNESKFSGRRNALRSKCTLFEWDVVTNIEHAISEYVGADRFQGLIELAADGDPRTIRMYEDQLFALLQTVECPKRPSLSELISSKGEPAVRSAFATAMCKGKWFKSEELGYALGLKMIEWGTPTKIESALRGFAAQLCPISTDDPRTSAKRASV